jgi:hypothetical protein
MMTDAAADPVPEGPCKIKHTTLPPSAEAMPRLLVRRVNKEKWAEAVDASIKRMYRTEPDQWKSINAELARVPWNLSGLVLLHADNRVFFRSVTTNDDPGKAVGRGYNTFALYMAVLVPGVRANDAWESGFPPPEAVMFTNLVPGDMSQNCKNSVSSPALVVCAPSNMNPRMPSAKELADTTVSQARIDARPKNPGQLKAGVRVAPMVFSASKQQLQVDPLALGAMRMAEILARRQFTVWDRGCASYFGAPGAAFPYLVPEELARLVNEILATEFQEAVDTHPPHSKGRGAAGGGKAARVAADPPAGPGAAAPDDDARWLARVLAPVQPLFRSDRQEALLKTGPRRNAKEVEGILYRAGSFRSHTQIRELVDLLVTAPVDPTEAELRALVANIWAVAYSVWLDTTNKSMGLSPMMTASTTPRTKKMAAIDALAEAERERLAGTGKEHLILGSSTPTLGVNAGMFREVKDKEYKEFLENPEGVCFEAFFGKKTLGEVQATATTDQKRIGLKLRLAYFHEVIMHYVNNLVDSYRKGDTTIKLMQPLGFRVFRVLGDGKQENMTNFMAGVPVGAYVQMDLQLSPYITTLASGSNFNSHWTVRVTCMPHAGFEVTLGITAHEDATDILTADVLGLEPDKEEFLGYTEDPDAAKAGESGGHPTGAGAGAAGGGPVDGGGFSSESMPKAPMPTTAVPYRAVLGVLGEDLEPPE